MWISTNSCYKLFSVVPNYCLCIFQIIERIYGDYILQHVPKMTYKYFARNTGNLKMRVSEKTYYKLFNGAQNDSLSMFQIIETIYDYPIPQNNLEKFRKTGNLKMWISFKSCYKLFSVVQNYDFLCILQIIERIYDDPIPQNNLEKLRKTGNLKMWISTKSCYKLLSVVPNYFLYIFQITWVDIWWWYPPNRFPKMT